MSDLQCFPGWYLLLSVLGHCKNLSRITILFAYCKGSNSYLGVVRQFHLLIPLFHTGPESHELTLIDKYLDSWLNRTQFVMVLTDSHSP